LLWAPLLPFLLALLIRMGLPSLALLLEAEFGLQLPAYYPLIMSAFVLIVPATVGLIVGFLILDERDDRSLLTWMVSPAPITSYVLYRLTMPILLGMVVTTLSYPIAGLVPLNMPAFLSIVLLGVLSAPMMALVLATFAANKVAGFAVAKAMNGVMILPLLAYFIPEPWQYMAGIVPTYWPAKAFWQAAEGEPIALTLAIGFLVSGVILWLLVRRFYTVLYR